MPELPSRSRDPRRLRIGSLSFTTSLALPRFARNALLSRPLLVNQRLAFKTLLPDIAADPRSLARFKQETLLSRQVAHPNVCRVFDLSRHTLDARQLALTTVLVTELQF